MVAAINVMAGANIHMQLINYIAIHTLNTGAGKHPRFLFTFAPSYKYKFFEQCP